ncbi:MAG: hypothetical protein VR67_10780 [Peptococcaceae bacterium BRH_c8a]|nr:MAG: hypothetical protein VR67_10780 [Peptococcaceae bacterium BRH_c8a]
MLQIPFMNLISQYEKIKPEIFQAINNVLDSANFIMGPEVTLFEQEFAAFCGARHCIGVSNGTDALLLALDALDVGSGDLVLTVPNTFIATTEAITRLGAQPVFVDINPETFVINPDSLELTVQKLRSINAPVKAIIAVHLYGHPCDMEAVKQIAQRYELRVVEDAAQAHGAEYKGKRTGTLGDVACFSFYPGKNLGAYGDAGAVVTNDQQIADKVAMLRNHGRIKKYEHLMEGYNCRLDTLQAAILRVKLNHLDEWTRQRIANANQYSTTLAELPSIVIPLVTPGARHVYHLYVIRVANRPVLIEYLQRAGVSTGIHYPLPLHLQPAYRHLGYREGDFPAVEKASREILSLPLDAEITASQINYVCQTIKQSLSEIKAAPGEIKDA